MSSEPEDNAGSQSPSSMQAADAMDTLQQAGHLPGSHEEAYKVHRAALHKLQLQMKEIAETQHAAIKQLHQRMEEIAEMSTATLKELQLQNKLFAKSHFADETTKDDSQTGDNGPHGLFISQGQQQ